MFAYCSNNPLMYSDAYGTFPWLVVGVLAASTIIGIIVGACMDTPIGSDIQETPEDMQQTIAVVHKPQKPRPCSPFALEPDSSFFDIGITDSENNLNSQASGQVVSETEPRTLTAGQRVTNALVGGTIGLMIGGAIVLTGGAACCIIAGPSATIGFLGMTGMQAVSWGGLAYDVFPIFVAPFYGMEMEPLEITP